MPASSPRRQRLIGIGLMAITVFFFAGLDGTAKWLCRELPVPQVVWARYFSSFLVILPLVNPWRVPGLLRSSKPFLQITRALLILISTGLNFVALRYLQLDQTMSIMFMTPLLVAIIAGPLLGEWIGPHRAVAAAVGFIGVLIITQPGLSGFHPAMILSLAGAFIYAVGNVITRILSRHDPSTTTLFFVGAVGSLMLTPVVPFVWVWPQSALTWGLMIVMGACGALGHWCLILAHKYAPAAILAPFIYTQIIWMTALGWLVFDQVPSHTTIIGAAVVIASGIYLLWRERIPMPEAAPKAERG